MAELDPLIATCNSILASMAPAKRADLAKEMAKRLLESQSKRIGDQLNPDGSPYAPRKPQTKLRKKKGAIRRGMYAKLRTRKWMKADSNANVAVVTFAAQAQRIAKVSQYGLRDKVNRNRGPEVQYPVRELLGVSPADFEMIEELAIKHIAG